MKNLIGYSTRQNTICKRYLIIFSKQTFWNIWTWSFDLVHKSVRFLPKNLPWKSSWWKYQFFIIFSKFHIHHREYYKLFHALSIFFKFILLMYVPHFVIYYIIFCKNVLCNFIKYMKIKNHIWLDQIQLDNMTSISLNSSEWKTFALRYFLANHKKRASWILKNCQKMQKCQSCYFVFDFKLNIL